VSIVFDVHSVGYEKPFSIPSKTIAIKAIGCPSSPASRRGAGKCPWKLHLYGDVIAGDYHFFFSTFYHREVGTASRELREANADPGPGDGGPRLRCGFGEVFCDGPWFKPSSPVLPEIVEGTARVQCASRRRREPTCD